MDFHACDLADSGVFSMKDGIIVNSTRLFDNRNKGTLGTVHNKWPYRHHINSSCCPAWRLPPVTTHPRVLFFFFYVHIGTHVETLVKGLNLQSVKQTREGVK
jgi:hypothetical protein